MTAGRPRNVSGPWKYSSTPASAGIAAHAGLVSLPAATNEGAGRNTASTKAHTARASVAYRSPSIRYQSKLTCARYPAAGGSRGAAGARHPSGAHRAPERCAQLRGPGSCDVGSGLLGRRPGRGGRLGGAGAGHARRRPGRGGLAGRRGALAGRGLGGLHRLDRLLGSGLDGLLGRLGGLVDLLLRLLRDLGGLRGGLLRDRGDLVGGLGHGLGGVLEDLLDLVLDGVDGGLGPADDAAEARLGAELLDDAGTALGERLDGRGGLGPGGLDEARDGAADGLGAHGGGELGGRGAGLLDTEVGLDAGLAGQGLGARAQRADDGLGALDGQVTGADRGQQLGLVELDGGLAVLLHGLGGGHADSLEVEGVIWGWEAFGVPLAACSRT